jgi:hypothetical protein
MKAFYPKSSPTTPNPRYVAGWFIQFQIEFEPEIAPRAARHVDCFSPALGDRLKVRGPVIATSCQHQDVLMKFPELSAILFRWSARIIGLSLVFLVLAIAIGERVPDPLTQPIDVQFGFLGLTLILVGIVAGLWREFAGGLISLIGWFIFFVPFPHSPHEPNWLFWMLAVPGLLYLLSAMLRGNEKKPPTHPM